MKTSKVGSANTYTRCLRELNDWGYIDYQPSHNPSRGSLVNLYRFDTSTEKSCDNSTDPTPVIALRPSINSINKKKHINNTNIDQVDSKIDQPTKSKRENFISPSLDEVKAFFKEKNKTDLEAEKFFNHFESNGWLVGGKSKMKNWQAAARNWISRSEEYAKTSSNNTKPKPGNLNVNQNKDYSVPL